MDNEASPMPDSSTSRFSRLLSALFPRMPDFHGLLNDQCDLVVRAMDEFVAFMETGDAAKAKEVRRLEHEGDKLKARNIDVLNRSFSTPFDREDIYRAITTIDEGLNYAKTTVREMEVLGIEPDTHMLEIARLLHQGAKALQTGFARLKANPLAAERDTAAVRKTERQTEKVYRKAIAELFDPEHYAQELAERRREPGEDLELLLEPMDQAGCSSVAKGLSFVMEALKRREIYRHLSNAADHLAHAGDILHDIVVKTA
tara:strand:+ start:14154 stop:14927 length:774 start_codon:yes stop_codon:yes gene_type:complete